MASMKTPRTHVLFPGGVDYHSGLHSSHSIQPQKKSALCRVRYIMLENSSIMLLSVTQKKPSIMPEIMLEKYSIMLT